MLAGVPQAVSTIGTGHRPQGSRHLAARTPCWLTHTLLVTPSRGTGFAICCARPRGRLASVRQVAGGKPRTSEMLPDTLTPLPQLCGSFPIQLSLPNLGCPPLGCQWAERASEGG